MPGHVFLLPALVRLCLAIFEGLGLVGYNLSEGEFCHVARILRVK